MKIKLFLTVLFTIVFLSCNSKNDVGVRAAQSNSDNVSPALDDSSSTSIKSTRREYWPLDNDVFEEDTVVQLKDTFLIKTNNYSLNDSAVIHTATDDLGQFLVHSHNRVVEVTILKNQKQYIKSILSKNIFEKNTELQLTGTSFQRYSNGEHVFRIEACIPDTDVCDVAEVAMNNLGKVRVVQFLSNEADTNTNSSN
ncbi:hypothetical protein [Nibribacter koreensis]|uniref:Lipoprotein n=1 Tax=Nibribacter koreensis TaxID=1084519 RepID=A0ABP8FX84_9BACT